MSELVVEVGGDGRWAPLALAGDVDAESAATAAELLRIRGEEDPDPERLDQVTALLAGLARHMAQSDDEEFPLVVALALVPEQDPVPLGVATLRMTDAVDSLDDAVDELVAPPEERYDDPVVDRLETPLGPAIRIAQRLVDDQSAVNEWVGYAWYLADAERLLVLSATFADLVEAGRWTEAFDDLARLVKVWIEE